MKTIAGIVAALVVIGAWLACASPGPLPPLPPPPCAPSDINCMSLEAKPPCHREHIGGAYCRPATFKSYTGEVCFTTKQQCEALDAVGGAEPCPPVGTSIVSLGEPEPRANGCYRGRSGMYWSAAAWKAIGWGVEHADGGTP